MIENRLVRFNEGDTLFYAGETSNDMYIIRSGRSKQTDHKRQHENVTAVIKSRGEKTHQMLILIYNCLRRDE